MNISDGESNCAGNAEVHGNETLSATQKTERVVQRAAIMKMMKLAESASRSPSTARSSPKSTVVSVDDRRRTAPRFNWPAYILPARLFPRLVDPTRAIVNCGGAENPRIPKTRDKVATRPLWKRLFRPAATRVEGKSNGRSPPGVARMAGTRQIDSRSDRNGRLGAAVRYGRHSVQQHQHSRSAKRRVEKWAVPEKFSVFPAAAPSC